LNIIEKVMHLDILRTENHRYRF